MTETAHKQNYSYAFNKRLVTILGVSIVAVLTLLIIFQRPIKVEVASLQRDVPITVFGLGTVEARVLSEVGFEVGATLIELNADHGEYVVEGAVLARLHDAEQSARVAKAKAGIANAVASLNMNRAIVEKARTVLAQRAQTNKRQQRLLTQNTVSKEVAEDAQLQKDMAAADLLVASSEVEVARAKMIEAEAQLEYENVLLDHHILRAPYDALVVRRQHELGSVINAGEALFTLVDTATVWALAYVDESRAGQVRVGQPAEVHLRSLPRTVFPGHVVRIDIESDRVNEERRIYVECDQCPESFHLGEQAEVFITVMELKQAILIPETAIVTFTDSGGKIWVVKDERLQLVDVEFGARTLDGQLEISRGMAEGMSAVVKIRDGLRQGRRVRVSS